MPTNPSQRQGAGEVLVFPIATMDVRQLAVTAFYVLFASALTAGLVVGAFLASGAMRWVMGIAAGLVAAGATLAFVLLRLYGRPRHFEISPEGLRIVWPARSRKLPRGAFAEMRILNPTDLGPMKRRMGMSGIWGSFGWFQSEYLGNLDAYITRESGQVYLRMVNRHPLLLTPEDPQAFLDALERMTAEEDASR